MAVTNNYMDILWENAHWVAMIVYVIDLFVDFAILSVHF